MSTLRSSDLAFGGPKPKVRDVIAKRVALVKPLEGWELIFFFDFVLSPHLFQVGI